MKEDIRRRRQERIRQLTLKDIEPTTTMSKKHHQPITSSAIRTTNSEKPLSTFTAAIESTSDEESQDPEAVWKAAGKQWEERYGWPEMTQHPPIRRRFAHTVRLQLAGAVLLCVCVAAVLRVSSPWTDNASFWVRSALTQDMNLAPIAAWYEATFGGSPAFIPIWTDYAEQAQEANSRHKLGLPLRGTIAQPFALNLKGIELAPNTDDRSVRTAATGKVMDVIRDPKEGTTVLVQHTDGYVTLYGRLELAQVHVDDWLESGETIGSIKAGTDGTHPATLFFAIKKNGQYVDPADVIDLD